MSERPDHVSTFALDALALGALSPEESERIREHLSSCPRCSADYEEASKAREHFVREVLPRAAQRFRRLEEPRRRFSLRWFPLALAAPLAAAAALAIFVLPQVRHPSLRPWEELTKAPEPDSDLRIKGGPVLQAVARRGSRTFRVDDKAALAPGDELRFIVQPSGFEYVLIASVDGDGQATVYFPYDGTQSARLESKGGGELPTSIVLDAARGPERVFAFFSHDPLPSAPVLAELRRLGARGADAIRVQRTVGVSGGAKDVLLHSDRQPRVTPAELRRIGAPDADANRAEPALEVPVSVQASIVFEKVASQDEEVRKQHRRP